MEEEIREEHDHPNRREPDEGEVRRIEPDKWSFIAKRIRKNKKESESAKSEGMSSDDEGIRGDKRRKASLGMKKRNTGTLSKSQSFTSKVREPPVSFKLTYYDIM
jgi:hypothetical protein